VGPLELSFNEDGTANVEINGEMHTIDVGEDGLSATYSDIHEWLVLAHVPSAPLVMDSGAGPLYRSVGTFPHFFHTPKQNATRRWRKCLVYLVGDAGFEPATPAV
jgi:hypothetical protein